MAVNYTPAPQAETIGKRLVNKHHTDLSDVRIEYVFRSEAAKVGDKQVYGRARKVGGINAFLAREHEDDTGEAFFVVELALDVWTIIDKEQREALVDQQLCHLGITFNEDGDSKLFVKPVDLQEFNEILERHGMWNRDVEKFLKVAAEHGQLSFVADTDDPPEAE